jgi:hypothetical protein
MTKSDLLDYDRVLSQANCKSLDAWLDEDADFADAYFEGAFLPDARLPRIRRRSGAMKSAGFAPGASATAKVAS